MEKPTLASLTAEYNQIPGIKPIKKFSCSLGEAQARVKKAQQKAGIKTSKAPKQAKAQREPGQPRTGTIKALVVQLLEKATPTAEIVEAVLADFPEAKFNAKHVFWYRSRLGYATARTRA